MVATSIACPACRAEFKLKAAIPPGKTSTKCPKCGGVIPLGAPPKPESDQTTAFETGTPPRDETNSGVAATPTTNDYPFLAPAQAPEELGRLGTYRVLGVLGSGGMGAVFRAEDPALKRHIALKVMLPHYASKPGGQGSFPP